MIPYAVAGKWESLQWTLDVWVLDLKTSETKLTGTVSITPGPGRPPSRPADIYDGKIDKNQIEFKVKSPDNMRVITFSGTVTGSEIRFTRKVEMQPGASTGGDDLLGSEGPQTFVVKRCAPCQRVTSINEEYPSCRRSGENAKTEASNDRSVDCAFRIGMSSACLQRSS